MTKLYCISKEYIDREYDFQWELLGIFESLVLAEKYLNNIIKDKYYDYDIFERYLNEISEQEST